MKKGIVRIWWTIAICFCLVTVFPASIIAVEIERENQSQLMGNHYTFDTQKVLEEHETDTQDLFVTIPEEGLEDWNPQKSPSTKWKQQDFFDVLNLFHRTVFHQPLEEKVNGARFSVPSCDQISFGPQEAVFFTHKVSAFEVTNYSYYIDLNSRYIHWRGASYQPIISWPITSLNFSRIKVTAEEALQIAEKQGGEAIRLANHNQCNLDIVIDSSHRHGNWIVTYNSTIDGFTALLRLEIDSNTGRHKVLTEGGAGYYTFNAPQIIDSISNGMGNIFQLQATPNEMTTITPPVSWTQAEFYLVAKEFNKVILGEELNDWNIRYVSFDLDCDDVVYGPQEMRFSFVRLNSLTGDYFEQEVWINSRTGTLTWNIEYDYDVNLITLLERKQEVIDQSWIKVPAEAAMSKVYEEEGKNLHLALKNSNRSCLMRGLLDNFSGHKDSNTLEWHVTQWENIPESSGTDGNQLSAFVNIKTGKLRYFKFYRNIGK